MSEYQYIHFQAADQPLDDEQLEFMEQQSTRANISRWDFSNEYHFGNFRGDAREMLRRGFDVHLHYANFGIRKLMFRLPAGLPWQKQTFEAFLSEYGVEWKPDKQGRGGILEFDPEADAGTYDEDVWEFDGLISGLGKLRELLIGGDLRPLYILWLACCWDDEEMEPPVPAGLSDLPRELVALAEFYEVHKDLLEAAAERSPAISNSDDTGGAINKWIAGQKKEDLREIVTRMLTGDAVAVRAEMLATVRDESGGESWPVAEATRTCGELVELAESQQTRRLDHEATERQAVRAKHLAAIVADPDGTIATVKELVKLRSTSEYDRAAQYLADLREALGPTRGPNRASQVAEQLVKQHPTLNRLKSALRKQKLLAK